MQNNVDVGNILHVFGAKQFKNLNTLINTDVRGIISRNNIKQNSNTTHNIGPTQNYFFDLKKSTLNNTYYT